MKNPSVDISTIIVSYNTSSLLYDNITALQNSAGDLLLQKIIIDNASRDDSVTVLQRDFKDCELIINGTNVGFGRANNQALPLIQGRYVLLLNTDAFVAPDTLKKTVAYMETHPQCGALGVKLIGRDAVLQPSCRYFPTPLNIFLQRTGLGGLLPWVTMIDDMDWDHASTRSCDWVPGCYFLIRREVIEQVGLFDPKFFLYYEEVDFCFSAIKAGWQIHYFPDATVVHIGGESAKSDSVITKGGRQIESIQIESELLYFRKNHGVLATFSDVVLHTLADFIVPFKKFLKFKKSVYWRDHWIHINLVWSIYKKTSFGCVPIR